MERKFKFSIWKRMKEGENRTLIEEKFFPTFVSGKSYFKDTISDYGLQMSDAEQDNQPPLLRAYANGKNILIQLRQED